MSASTKNSQSSTDTTTLIKNICAQKECPASLLILSTDQTRRRRALKYILDNFSKLENPSMLNAKLNIVEFDCRDFQESDLAQLQTETFSMSLFVKTTYICLQQVQELKADMARKLLALLKQAPTQTKIILLGSELADNSSLKKHFIATNTLLEFIQLSGLDLVNWIKKELKFCGATTYSPRLIDEIIELSNSSLDQIVSIIDRLSLHADEGKIADGDLAKLFSEKPSASEFELIEDIGRKRPVEAELKLRKLIASGKNAFPFLSLINKTFSNYLMIKSSKQGSGSKDLLGMPAWLYNKQAAATQNYTTSKLRANLDSILRADTKLKGKSLGPELILSDLINRLAPK